MERTDKEWQAAIGLKISEVLQDTAVPSTIFASITRPTDKLFPSTVDHTLLKPDATSAQIDQLCDEAIRYGFKSCCVNGVHVKQVSARLLGSSTIPCAVIGFPLGASTTAVKVFEAQDAVSCGAQEIDMVIDIGALKSQSYLALFTDIRAVVQGSFPIPVKVILETVFLSDEEKIAGAFVAAEAGAAFVKTCTGFMGGGATKEDVELLWKTIKYREGDVKVKASAAVRSFDKCVEMLKAGAERIGTSSGAVIMQGTGVFPGTY